MPPFRHRRPGRRVAAAAGDRPVTAGLPPPGDCPARRHAVDGGQVLRLQATLNWLPAELSAPVCAFTWPPLFTMVIFWFGNVLIVPDFVPAFTVAPVSA